jgi:type I restriction enzyme S subunit
MSYTPKNIPNGWALKKMPDVVKWSSGGTPKATEKSYYENGTIPWLIIGDLNDGVVTTSASKITELGLQNSSAKMIPVGTLLVAMYGSIGKLGITGIECCTNQAIAYAKELKGVSTKYMYYYMAMMKSELISQGKGGTQKNISQTVLNSLEVLVPPEKEQKRIVNKIEELFSELDSAVETLKKTKEQLAVYRQSVLKDAFEREKDGKFLKIKDFANVGTGATPLKTRQDYYNGDIAWVSSGKVNDKKIYTPTAYITEKALEETNCSVYPAHTIVVAMYGEGKTRGQCAELMIDAATNQALAAIVLQDNSVICKDFLLWFLTLNYEELRRKAAGGVQPNLNLNLVKNISIPYYDMDTQTKIISEIESKLTVCENIEKTANDALIQADAMRQSILKKAFEGEL